MEGIEPKFFDDVEYQDITAEELLRASSFKGVSVMMKMELFAAVPILAALIGTVLLLSIPPPRFSPIVWRPVDRSK